MRRIKVEKLNPSVKAITVLLAAILISFQYITALNTAIFVMSLLVLLFFSDAKPKRFITIFIPALVAAFGIFLLGLYYARGNTAVTESLGSLSTDPYAVRAAMMNNLSTALQLSTRLLAYAGLGIMFALTTDGEEFIEIPDANELTFTYVADAENTSYFWKAIVKLVTLTEE